MPLIHNYFSSSTHTHINVQYLDCHLIYCSVQTQQHPFSNRHHTLFKTQLLVLPSLCNQFVSGLEKPLSTHHIMNLTRPNLIVAVTAASYHPPVFICTSSVPLITQHFIFATVSIVFHISHKQNFLETLGHVTWHYIHPILLSTL